MKKRNWKILALPAVIFISGCASPTCERDIIQELQPIIYKHISIQDYECLSDDTYMKFKYNDVACELRVDTLTKTIKAHNKN